MWPTNKKNYGTWNRCLFVFCPGNFHVTNDRSCSILESPSHSVEFVICIHQNWDPYSLSQVMFPKYDCWNDWTWTILKLTTRIPNWINPIKVTRPKKLYITVFSFHCEGKCPGDLLRAVARSEAVGAQMVMEDDGLKLGTPWISKSPELVKQQYI